MTMNQIIVSNLPTQFHNSDIYKTYIEEYKDEQMVLTHPRPLKLDDKYEDFQDILHILDTCAYLGCGLPWNVYDFAYSAPPYLLTIMKKFKNDSVTLESEKYEEYYHFANTPEFEALQLCCEYSFDEYLQTKPFVFYAVKHGSLLAVKYFEYKCEYLVPKNIYIILQTVAYGRVDILEHFMSKKWYSDICNKDATIVSHAVNYGQIKILELLHKRGVPILSETIDDAINGAQYECLVFLLKNGVKPLEYSLSMAVAVSELEYVVALVESGTPVNNKIYTLIASQRGRINILRYLHKCGAPWHENAVNASSRKAVSDIPDSRYRECAEFGISCNAPFDKDIVQKYLYRKEWVQKLKMFGLPVPPIYPTDDVWMLENDG